jgi:hypothetical protein
MDPAELAAYQRRLQVASEGYAHLMSIREAEARGFTKLRLDKWANPDDYLEFTIVEGGGFGPWVKLWSPANEIVGNENPHKMLITLLGDPDDPCWRPLPRGL